MARAVVGCGPAQQGRVSIRILHSRWFVPLTVFVVCWTLTTHGKYSAAGDEPHYLIVSQSLLADGDLDVRNNYATGQSRRFGGGGLEPGPHARETQNGRLLSVHDVGVPVALLPVYTVATSVSGLVPESVLRRFRMNRGLFAYSLISLFIIGMTSGAAALTRAALIADGAPAGVASAVVLAVWLSPPVLSNSFLVFPEPFALLLTAWALRTAVASPQVAFQRPAMLFLLALGLLPWFHRKYALYGMAVLLTVAWHRRGTIAGMTKTERAAALALFATPQIALALWTLHHWGNIGGALVLERAPFSLGALRTGWLGLLVDRENGLLVWAPIYLLLPVAWTLAWRRTRLWLLPTASLFFMSAAHDQWWGGFSPAARFLVPLCPVFAFVGVILVRDRSLRRACLALLVPQVLISAYGWQHPRALWPQGDGHNRVIAAILGWVGGSEGILPALRASVPATTRALAMITGVAVVNGAAWIAARGRKPVEP